LMITIIHSSFDVKIISFYLTKYTLFFSIKRLYLNYFSNKNQINNKISKVIL
jgi:hypothetical protein